MTRISILLVDDHPVVREGYRRLLESRPKFSVCAEAEDVAQAFVDLALARKTTGGILTVDGGNIAAALR